MYLEQLLLNAETITARFSAEKLFFDSCLRTPFSVCVTAAHGIFVNYHTS